jgi:hypothetical protein
MKDLRIKIATISAALALTALVSARPAAAETHFSIGVGVGSGYGYYTAPPPAPGPDYYWTNGYNDHGSWRAGYWARRAYAAPRNYGRDYRHDFDRDDHRGHDRNDDRDRGRRR